MSRPSLTQRPSIARVTAVTAAAGGVIIAILGVVALIAPAVLNGHAWFLAASVGAALLTAAILALRADLHGVPLARPALAVAAVGMALFALAHLYTLIDVDTAILLFSIFMVVTAVSLIVAGVAVAKAAHGPARFLTLLCGVWPLATIPAGAALGDIPHFTAITIWGLCWIALAASLPAAAADLPHATTHHRPTSR
jgi:hypothetical protein